MTDTMSHIPSSASAHPITEDDIAQFLVHTPDFFERHAELLATVQLTSPHGRRAVSLQERQAEMLRDKIRGLEHRVMDMVRHGNDNVVLSDKLLAWTRQLLLTSQAEDLPEQIASLVADKFMVPQVAIKVWGVSQRHAQAEFATGVSDDARLFANSLGSPFCGLNTGFEAAGWLFDPSSAKSIALLPLRPVSALNGDTLGAEPAFGMVVLASPDPQRFHADMGTDFLERIASVASAALVRLM
ncbi:MAG: hypothetical protein RLZZ126_253 [Pseudomonadota bacterium]|jgi:uncharacterized protein